ncbi:MAG: hypothetical protein LBD14_06045 [Puniceicoccales bacterium]|jgi:hypothetical protein|nr:hypothetical protein [Puniceicoccales bacterium]
MSGLAVALWMKADILRYSGYLNRVQDGERKLFFPKTSGVPCVPSFANEAAGVLAEVMLREEWARRLR